MYIHELDDWPRFHWSAEALAEPLASVSCRQGRLAGLAKCSQDTAHRDILALVDNGVLVRNPEGGRSTSYSLAPFE